MAHEIATISGNQDRLIYEVSGPEIVSNPTMQFILNELGSQPLQWLKGVPFSHQLTSDIFLCHCTPNDDLLYLLEDDDGGYPVFEVTMKYGANVTEYELICVFFYTC